MDYSKIKVIDSETSKFLRSDDYNYNFNKKNGHFSRWGKTHDDDPDVGVPEIADIEITTICDGAKMVGCEACYKLNTGVGVNMQLETFKKILERLPVSVNQIAFGVDFSCTANPETFEIFKATREAGIIPNVTVAKISDETADKLASLCGAVAISKYKNKNLCYDSVKRLTDRGMNQVNLHQMVCEETFEQCLETIQDVKTDPRLAKLNAVVFLSLKRKGRGVSMTPLRQDKYRELINLAIDSGIGFGADSCGAHRLLSSLVDHPKYDVIKNSVEPCESSLFSTYIDVHGKFFPCSFTPDSKLWGSEGLDVLECEDFLRDIWDHPKTKMFRESLLLNERNCPLWEV